LVEAATPPGVAAQRTYRIGEAGGELGEAATPPGVAAQRTNRIGEAGGELVAANVNV
jgi:hypothetical protein